MSRNRRLIKPKPILFIACEGTSSEYQYFESWAQTDEASEIFERVNVYPDEDEDRPKTTPYQLFQRAKKELDDKSADFAWIVFDRDNHPNLPKTFKEAEAAGVKIAFSSRSFEEWVLMHFEKNNTIFNATECKDGKDKSINCGSNKVPNCNPTNCLSGHIRRQSFISSYSKKREFDLFSAIKKNTEIAIVNAAWLRLQQDQSQPDIWQLNPYTDVDRLILKLHERLDKVKWGNAGNATSINNWTIIVLKQSTNIILEISHTLAQPQVLNNNFEQTSFFTTDDELNSRNCIVINKNLIQNAHGSTTDILRGGDVVKYTLMDNNQPYFLFSDKITRTRIFIQL